MQRITRSALTRRQVLAGSALAATAVPIVHVAAQGSAGRVSCGFWDHWVPAGNGTLREMCQAWGAREKVEVQVDFITSVGNQNLLTIAAESQSRSGHDILSFPTWEPGNNADMLEPVDDVMGRLIAKYGAVAKPSEYLGKRGGKWVVVPAVAGSQQKPSVCRLDLLAQHAGIKAEEMWPAADHTGPGADGWTWDTFLVAAEKCHKAGVPFGLPMGQFSDAVDWVGACLNSFGASMLDEGGKIMVRDNAKLRAAVEYLVKLAKFLPNDVWAWDDASNNRAIQAGKTALIFNPPSAYAVAKRDNMAGWDRMYTFPMPSGPAGRFVPYLPYFWGIWNFSRSKVQAKALLEHLSEREQAEKMTSSTSGYDIPPFLSMNDFAIWKNEAPPPGVVFNYPVKPHHKATQSIAFAPAPAEIAVQAYNQAINTKLIARIAQGGETVDQALAWAERELKNFARG